MRDRERPPHLLSSLVCLSSKHGSSAFKLEREEQDGINGPRLWAIAGYFRQIVLDVAQHWVWVTEECDQTFSRFEDQQQQDQSSQCESNRDLFCDCSR